MKDKFYNEQFYSFWFKFYYMYIIPELFNQVYTKATTLITQSFFFDFNNLDE